MLQERVIEGKRRRGPGMESPIRETGCSTPERGSGVNDIRDVRRSPIIQPGGGGGVRSVLAPAPRSYTPIASPAPHRLGGGGIGGGGRAAAA